MKVLLNSNCLILSIILVPFSLSSQSFTKLFQSNLNQSINDSRSVVLFDLDNNSYPDILFTNRGSHSHDYYQNYRDTIFPAPAGNGFSSITQIAGAVLAGDLNADCWPDIYIANGSGGQGSVNLPNVLLENDGTGSFTVSGGTGATNVSSRSLCISMPDLNRDGYLDIYVSNVTSGNNELYVSDSSSILNYTHNTNSSISNQSFNSRGIAWCDYDDDGDLDLFLCVPSGNNKLFRNDTNGFVEISVGDIVNDGGSSFSASWGDLDGDGLQDLVVTNSDNSTPLPAIFYYRNLGNGNFQKITTGVLANTRGKFISSAIFDVDNDGHLDVVFCGANPSNNSIRRNKLLINDGNGNFTNVTSGSLVNDQTYTASIGIADLDRDGDLDIVLASNSGRNEIYINDLNTQNFVSLNLLGTNGKATASYAKLKYKCALDGLNSTWQYRRNSSNTGFASQSSPVFHLGTGQATIVDSIVIQWYDGSTCYFENIAVGEFFNIDPVGCRIDTVLDATIVDSSVFLNAYFNADSSKGNISRYHWDFGDGDTSNLMNPSHRYSSPGRYTVSLSLYDSYCKWDSLQVQVDICPDTSSIGFFNTAQGRTVTFTDTSIGNGYQFIWNFGDGRSDTGKTVTTTYASTSTFAVCLTVIDSCRSKQICKVVTVCNDTLNSNFSSSVNGLNASFTDSSLNATNFQWDFGDGQSSNQRNPTHQYIVPGFYYVCLTVSDNCTSSTSCDSIAVCLDTASANFGYTANNLLVNFSDSSVNSPNIYWDFGDGNFSVVRNPIHIYSNYGTYNVCQIATNSCYQDTFCENVVLCPFQASASFNYTSLQSPLFIQFTSTSQDAISYSWDFGDGSGSSNQNPLKVYSNQGSYPVCLTITDSCGLMDSTCETLDLYIGIEEYDWISSFSIYPNPADDILHLEFDKPILNDLLVAIIDVSGKSHQQILLPKGGTNLRVSIQDLPVGVYVLTLRIGLKLSTWNFIKSP